MSANRPGSILIAMIVASTLIGSASAGVAAPIAITGRVVNGTSSAAAPQGLTVTAAQVTSGGKETQRLTTSTQADGTFRFDGFSGDGSHFVIAATYLDVTYSTVKDVDGSQEMSVELRVFETTRDRSSIDVISDSVTVIQGEDDDFEVLQLLRLMNRSDRTYVGNAEEDAGGVIELPVAVGGFDVAAGEGITPNRVRPSDVGMVANDPLQPGSTDLSYSYKLRVPRTGLAFARPTAYPTAHVDILVGPGLELTSPGFRFVESKRFGDKDFRRYRSGPIDPGSVVEADIAHASSADLNIWLGLGSILTFVTALVLLGAARHRRARLGQTEATPRGRQELIEEIARLDESHSRGELEDDVYRKRRKELKDELVVLTEHLVP